MQDFKELQMKKDECKMYGLSMGLEYLQSIGKTDLMQLNEAEALTFSNSVIQNATLREVELVILDDEIPF